MAKPSEISGELQARIEMPTDQGLESLARQMTSSGVEPPIDPEVITGLEDATKNSDRRVLTDDIDELCVESLWFVLDIIQQPGGLDVYENHVGVDSPQARFVRHIADNHTTPRTQEDLAQDICSSLANGTGMQEDLTTDTQEEVQAQVIPLDEQRHEPLFPSVVGIGCVAIAMNAKGIQPIIDAEIIRDLTNRIKKLGSENKEDINLLRVISMVKIFGLLENTAKLNEFVDQVGADSPEARFMQHMAKNYKASPAVEHAIIDKIQD